MFYCHHNLHAKHNAKEREKYNRGKGKEYFNIEKFQLLADRTLRYELTIRNLYLNYLFKQQIFRKNCAHYKMNYRNYLRIENAMQRNDCIAQKAGKLPDKEKKAYLLVNPYESIDKNDRETYKHVSRLLSKKTHFMLETDFSTDQYNHKTVNYSCDEAKFSKSLLTLCLKKLVEFIQDFQIKELPAEESVREAITRHDRLTHAYAI